MAFMETTSGGGAFNPFIKYNAKAGRWYSKRDDSTDTEEFEVSDMTAVVDLERLQTGWFLFEAGTAPASVIDAQMGVAGEKPGGNFKRGFQCLFFSPKNFPSSGVREFSTTASIVIESFNNLHTEYANNGSGKLPVVKCIGVDPITSKHGTNYQPKFEIIDWVDRPAELDNATMESSSAPATPAPSATSDAGHQPPPAVTSAPPAAASPPAADDGNLF